MLFLRQMRLSGIALTLTATLVVSSNSLAATIGSASVSMVDFTRPTGRAELELTLRPDAVQEQTPLASLNRRSDKGAAQVGAIVGVDVPAGALFAWGSGNVQSSGLGLTDQGDVSTENRVRFTDSVQIASLTLPPGTPVDVEVQCLVAWSGMISGSGEPTGSVVRTFSQLVLQAGAATGYWTNFGGEGQQTLTPLTTQAVVGDTIFLSFDLLVETRAFAAANIDSEGRLFPAHADAGMTTTFVFGADVTVPEAAAARTLGTGAGNPGDVFLYSAALGGPLPGLETLDPANVAAHMLPLTPVPEPLPLLLVGLGVTPLIIHSRRR